MPLPSSEIQFGELTLQYGACVPSRELGVPSRPAVFNPICNQYCSLVALKNRIQTTRSNGARYTMYRALVQCGIANIVRIHVIIWGCMPIDSTVHVLYPAIGSNSARCPGHADTNNVYLEQKFRMGLVGDLSVVMAVLAVALPEGSEFVPPGWSGYLPVLVSLRGEPTPQSDFYERAEEEFAIPFSFLPLVHMCLPLVPMINANPPPY